MTDPVTAIPKGSWVLVTAANGHTGSHIVFELLKLGFKVRGTVRDLKSGRWLLDDENVSPYAKRGDMELVVADTSKPNDFDKAVTGVAAIIHVAVIGDLVPDPNVSIPATVESAISVCRSAAKESSVKRFVFTSTFWAATSPTPGISDTITNLDTWNDEAVEAAWAPPPYGPNRILTVYFAAKVEAEKAVWEFVKDRRLPWVVNSVSPCVIMGDPKDEKHLRSVPPQLVRELYLGNIARLQTPAMYYSHVSDVAVVHVAAAVDPEVRGKRIQVLAGSFNWNDALEILRNTYPERQFVDNFIPGDPKLIYQPQSFQTSSQKDEFDFDAIDGIPFELQQVNGRRYMRLAPKQEQQTPLEAMDDTRHVQSAGPVQLIGGAQKDGHTGFARPLSEDEQFLFDFYLNYVIVYGYKACYLEQDESAFHTMMKEVWLPNAMSQPSLMAAIFHVACRNYVIVTSNNATDKYVVKKLQYRLMCLKMAKDAVASEIVASDATIALALLMASESVRPTPFDFL
ncbi:hypothetical protein FLONG3_3206 [Fusarium longipes]|uniref:NAD-dependent epimerase/dehydratase domain-containing protein n=1 Tax=Fusarium longipes TaxID=694270 RepID=A0A395T2Q1_9HYPO|nr:hypothetical protein FLONG3_3206 [Fusarium longipes]